MLLIMIFFGSDDDGDFDDPGVDANNDGDYDDEGDTLPDVAPVDTAPSTVVVDFVDYEDGTNDYGNWEATPGNHDGGLANIAPDTVKFHESVGCTVGNIGFCHGHAWPSQEVMNSEILVMGHEHPAFSFRDRVDKLHSEPCWLRAPMIEHERYERVPDLLIVMPAFGELAGRTMNREPLKGLGPVLRNGLADLSKARVETLEGLEFGELGNLLDLRL